jgi:RHS repeat-associated protein
VLSLPGRGTELNLSLTYNSRLWNKSGSDMTFDIDQDGVAPGWTLGFGKMVQMGSAGAMIIEANGTRHGYAGTVFNDPTNGNALTFKGYTTDGSSIEYRSEEASPDSAGLARYPDGTKVYYGNYSTVGPRTYLYPLTIIDANGNYTIINYTWNPTPRITSIIDTLGRLVTFHYSTDNLLTAITAPGLRDEAGNITTRTLVRIHYKDFNLQSNGIYGFATGINPIVRGTSVKKVIDAIYYPGTNTGYWFGDTNSFSAYGMIRKVVQQRSMGFTASSLTDVGTVTPGTTSSQLEYSYSLAHVSGGLTNPPTFETMTESWDSMDTAPVSTSYQVDFNTSPRTVSITHPNGTITKQYSYNKSSLPPADAYKDGLVYKEELQDPGTPNSILHKSEVDWEKGESDTARLKYVEITDERGQKTKTTYGYGPFNQVLEERQFGFDGVQLHRSRKTFLSYTDTRLDRKIYNTPAPPALPDIVWPRVLNLVLTDEVFQGESARVTYTQINYDEYSVRPLVIDMPDLVGHSGYYNPAPFPQGQGPDLYIKKRGNATSSVRYAKVDSATFTEPITSLNTFDMTGNLVRSSTSCCEQTSHHFTSATQYSHSTSKTVGSVSNLEEQIRTGATFDFNTGLDLTNIASNGRISTNIYFTNTWRLKEAILPTSARTLYTYDDATLAVTEITYNGPPPPVGSGAVTAQKIKRTNGLGLVRREESLGVNSVWDAVETQYDELRRVWKQTAPFRVSGNQRSETFYDKLGRVKKIISPDGSTTESLYNDLTRPRPQGASAEPGQTALVIDSWGREKWARNDADGRLVEVVEPAPNGNGSVATNGLVTRYSYTSLGDLSKVEQGSQVREFKYDALRRLTHQKLAEQSPTLNDIGQYVGVGGGGKWGDVYIYDQRSNVISRTDARGVKTNFSYDNDPLNRLKSLSYDTAGVGGNEPTVLPAPSVTYVYMTTGDITRPKSITTAGVSVEVCDYNDSEGRLSEKTLTLTSRQSSPIATSYIYDTLSRVTEMTYPAQYGMSNQPRKVVHYEYDIAGRIKRLQAGNVDYASDILYDEASQITSMKVGAVSGNQVTETSDFDPQTGLLINQKVIRSGSPLLDLSYDYLRPNTTSGRTKNVTRLINNLDHNRDRGYEYDTLGRLTKVIGGASTPWTQNYAYDRFGNRTGVTATGNISRIEPPRVKTPVLPSDEVTRRMEVSTPDTENDEKSGGTHDPVPPSDASSKNAITNVAPPLKVDDRFSDVSDSSRSTQVAPAVNLALGKPASQISTWSTATANLGVDGNTNGNWTDGSVATTLYESNPWWQVDLGSVRSIGSIQVSKRTDCCPDQLSNFYVIVSTVPFASTNLSTTLSQAGVTSYHTPGQGGAPTTINVNRLGRYVRIQAASASHLSLAEVQVWRGRNKTPYDFDGDGKSDLSVWRAPTGYWYILKSSDGSIISTQLGGIGDVSVPGDYDGDSISDIAIWQHNSGDWHIIKSSDGTTRIDHFGAVGDQPVPGDYDGDGKNDLAVWRPSTGCWYVLKSSNGTLIEQSFGGQAWGDKTVPADYDGDEKTDLAVWRPSIGYWYILKSSDGVTIERPFGAYGDVTVPSDYDGDGIIDSAVWRPSTGVWYIHKSSDSSDIWVQFGSQGLGDTPVPGDYDGDGLTDIAVWRTSTGYWYFLQSSTGALAYGHWGNHSLGDQAVPSSNVRTSNQSPTANAGGPYTGTTGTNVQFDGNASSDTDGTIANYTWNFGDGATGTGSTQAHTYTTTGTFTATLTVTDNLGAQSSANATVTISVPQIPLDGFAALTYDPLTNRITTPDFSYDSAGNQTRALRRDGGVQTFVYDAAGRVLKVKNGSGTSTVATYTYAASKSRLITQEGDENSDQRIYYAWDGESVIAEFRESASSPTSPQWQKNYIFLGTRLLAVQEFNGGGDPLVKYHHPDRLGTRLVTNAENLSVVEQVTLAFGTTLNAESTGSTNNRFTSYDRSAATGLDYAVNRYYDSAQGRFMQVDPIGMNAVQLANPQSLNLYVYCTNDPINKVDPSGTSWGSIFGFLGNLFSFFVNNVRFSFQYKSLPPLQVSFSTNFQSVILGFSIFQFQLRNQQNGARDPCAITTQLPMGRGRQGLGINSYVQGDSQRIHQYGTSATIASLTDIANDWVTRWQDINDIQAYLRIVAPPAYRPVRIGEISQRNGGQFGRHRGAAHFYGRGADIGLFRLDGSNTGGTYLQNNYDQILTQALVTMLEGRADVTSIIFNDPLVTGGDKLRRDPVGTTTHNNHLHVEFSNCND